MGYVYREEERSKGERVEREGESRSIHQKRSWKEKVSGEKMRQGSPSPEESEGERPGPE